MGIHIVGTYVQGTPVCTFALSPINYCMTINILLGQAWASLTLTWSTARVSIFIYIYIFISYVRLGHGANLCRVQNGQDGHPLCSRCMRLKYSLWTSSNEKEIVQNEADTPTSPPGKVTGIDRRNIANSSSPRSRISQDLKRSILQITPLYNAHKKATKNNTQQHNCF